MSMIQYEYDKNALSIEEQPRDDGVEYHIILKEENLKPVLREVRKYFESDDMYTDVMFYPHKDHMMQVIVRGDYNIPFLLELFRRKLLHTLKWKQ